MGRAGGGPDPLAVCHLVWADVAFDTGCGRSDIEVNPRSHALGPVPVAPRLILRRPRPARRRSRGKHSSLDVCVLLAALALVPALSGIAIECTCGSRLARDVEMPPAPIDTDDDASPSSGDAERRDEAIEEFGSSAHRSSVGAERSRRREAEPLMVRLYLHYAAQAVTVARSFVVAVARAVPRLFRSCHICAALGSMYGIA